MPSWWKGKAPAGEDPKQTARRQRIQREKRDQFRAQHAVARAIDRGDLIRPATCDECHKEGKVIGHHEDYSKPLEVQWLCPKCHGKRLWGYGRP